MPLKIRNQTGIALITAILIVSIVAASAVYLIDSGYTVMRKTQQRIDNEQFLQLANAVESFGVGILYRDNYFDENDLKEDEQLAYVPPTYIEEDENPLDYDPFNDSLFESWSKSQTPEFLETDLRENFIQNDVLYITDLNRFFNINNLHFSNSSEPAIKTAFKNNEIIFKELLQQIKEEDADLGENIDFDVDAISNEVIDWLDHDDDSREVLLFSEDDVYRRADSNFRPANRPVASVGELKNILGMTPELLAKLSKYIIALPVYTINAPHKRAFSPSKQGLQSYTGANAPVLTKINVNTCAPELLKGILAIYEITSALDLFMAEQGRFQSDKAEGKSTYKNLEQMYINNIPARIDPLDSNKVELENKVKLEIKDVADVYSQFFLVESFFQKTNGISFTLESLVYKNRDNTDEQPIVIQRQYDWLPSLEVKNSKESKEEEST